MTESYKNALACFCRQSARLQYVAEKRPCFPKHLLARELNLLEDAKLALLKEKKALGYTDELSFTDDAVFQGFSLKDGAFVGDYENAKKVSDAFLEAQRDATHFHYEVGVLLHFHARAARGDSLGIPELSKEERQLIRQQKKEAVIAARNERREKRLMKRLKRKMSSSVLQNGIVLF